MTISSGVFQTFANILSWWALVRFNACKGGDEYKKAVKELLELYYQRFNVIADDAAARIRLTATHYKNPATKQVTHVRTFREVAVDILHTPILSFLTSHAGADGYVLVHDAPGEAPVTKRHTAKERAKRQYKDRPPTQEELDEHEFELDEPMPWNMQQIFGTLAGRRKFLRALYMVLESADFRALLPPGKFVVFDGAIKEDGSWGVARITKEGSEWLDDVPLVREGDNAVMRWVHKLATSADPPGPNYLVTSVDGDVLLALMANYFRLESGPLKDITLTFHTKRKGKEFTKLLDDDIDQDSRGPDGSSPDPIVLELYNLAATQRSTAANFEQMVAGEITKGRVDFFFDIRAVAWLIREIHSDDPYAVESFLVALLVACDKHDFIWHRFLCTNVGVENVLPTHVVWAQLYGPLVTCRIVEGPVDCGRVLYVFDLRALFAFIRMIYYTKFYHAEQKRISKKNFDRTQSNQFLERIGRADLKDDLIAQPLGFKSGHGGTGMYDLDKKLMQKAVEAHLNAYKKNQWTLKAFREVFDVVPLEAFGPEDVFWMRLSAVGATQIAHMLSYMCLSPFGTDVSGLDADPETGRPYAAYTEEGYTYKPMVYYQDVLPDDLLRGKDPIFFRYPHVEEEKDDDESASSSSSSSSSSSFSNKARGSKRTAEVQEKESEWEGLDEWAQIGCKRQRTLCDEKTEQSGDDVLDDAEAFLKELG